MPKLTHMDSYDVCEGIKHRTGKFCCEFGARKYLEYGQSLPQGGAWETKAGLKHQKAIWTLGICLLKEEVKVRETKTFV